MSDYLYQELPKLGFGLMRLPTLPGGSQKDIDFDTVQKMVDLYMSRGFSYFDTAYVYHEGHSEEVIKKCLVPNYPRESFQVVDKIPLWNIKSKEDLEAILHTELERTGLEYLDILFLHGIGAQQFDMLEQVGAWDWLKSVKERGLAKHIGFSYHSPAEPLDDLLDKHPEVEVVQLQINYVDWDSEEVLSRLCWEACRRHNVAVTIMEPIKGGSLADPHPNVKEIFKKANPDASLASWALRFAASLDGVITVLSGMSTIGQMEQNIGFFKDFQPLNDKERAVIDEVIAALNARPGIPCTACRYCEKDCPQSIAISSVFSARNTELVFGNPAGAKGSYGIALMSGSNPADCIGCGQCEAACPQKISIVEELKKAVAAYGG